jgi:hypothetical protein
MEEASAKTAVQASIQSAARCAAAHNTRSTAQHSAARPTSLLMFSMMTAARRLTTMDRSRSARSMRGTITARQPSSMACGTAVQQYGGTDRSDRSAQHGARVQCSRDAASQHRARVRRAGGAVTIRLRIRQRSGRHAGARTAASAAPCRLQRLRAALPSPPLLAALSSRCPGAPPALRCAALLEARSSRRRPPHLHKRGGRQLGHHLGHLVRASDAGDEGGGVGLQVAVACGGARRQHGRRRRCRHLRKRGGGGETQAAALEVTCGLRPPSA